MRLSVLGITGGGNFTVDALTFGGAIDVNNVTASGAGTVSIGGDQGHLSASGVNQGKFTLDGANSSLVRYFLHHVMLVAM